METEEVTNTSVQHDSISSSSDMEKIEPPIKKAKIEANEKEEPKMNPKVDLVIKEQEKPVKKDEPSDAIESKDSVTNNHSAITTALPEKMDTNGVKTEEQFVEVTDKSTGPDEKVEKETASESSKTDDKPPKKESKGATDEDGFAGLDWKDGIASLPGSDLKFKMTEFGTLEIVSTVNTNKGDSEWSAPSQVKTEVPANKTEAPAKTPPKPSETSKPVSVIKKSQEGTTTTKKKDSRKVITDPNKVLTCEVCGKNGFPKDFSASGRFCSLKCVGQYTGRRNKGREFVRHVKTIDGKIIKKRKKKVPTPDQPSAEGESSGQTAANDVKPTEQDPTKVASEPVTIKKIKGTKKKIKRIQLDAASLASTDNVPYDSSKPFVWVDYLTACGAKAVPVSVFQQENPELNMFPKQCPDYLRGMKVEAIDPRHPSYICVCTVVRVRGARIRLHFDGWSESYDFWTNADSPLIFPVGWCDKNGQKISPPRGLTKSEFTYQTYLAEQNASGVPSHLFKAVSHKRHGFDIGMKLEAIDRKNPDLICVATVTNVIGNRFLVHFDEWDDTYDYWCEEDCPYIHPIGWCEASGGKLNPPNDDEVDTFTWEEYLKTTGAKAAPPELFKKRFSPGYKPGQKLEAVDKRNPSLIRAASVVDVEDYKVKLHFDGWDDIYDEWYDADSTELHPVSYCEKTGHPLEPPLTRADKISSAACPTPGCKGIGHVKGAKYSSHHSTFGCPYSLQNLNKESCLVDRLSTNSMTEESDWSYGKRDKLPRDYKDEPSSPTDMATSPSPSVEMNHHVTPHWKNRSTSSTTSNSDLSTNKRPLQRSTQSYPSKLMSSIASSSFTPSCHSPHCSNSKFNQRRHSFKDEKVTSEKIKLVEKGIQYVSPYYPTWGYGFAKVPVNGRRDYYSLTDDSPSKEKIAMGKWTTEQVEKHVLSIGCTEQAKLFVQQEIDGEAFLLLTQSDIVNIMNIKLGPALKIFNSIPKH